MEDERKIVHDPIKHTIKITKKVKAITLEFDEEGNFLAIAIEYE